MTNDSKKSVVIIHPDLGIGGAERLIVDAAVGLQNQGKRVVIFTSHCDPEHCFEEARDGTLDVRVRGNTIIPPSIFTQFSILCAILRQFHLVLQTSVFTAELSECKADIYLLDQLSACVPSLRLRYPQIPVLFYCHFPDKLLAYRENLIKSLYRMPFDWWESWSTGCSSTIVVNSNFTKGIFAEAFPSLRSRKPEVVYPCVSNITANSSLNVHEADAGPLWKNKKVVLSINRFERKKDIGLAVRAYAGLGQEVKASARLVIAGGYDTRVTENVSYHRELEAMASTFQLKTATARSLVSALSIPQDIDVLFLLSVPTSLKETLLKSSQLLVYTPKFEHFGIVPLEAMLSRIPVLASNTGGPKETVIDSKTGWLRSPDNVEEWTEILNLVLSKLSKEQLKAMGENGYDRVVNHFTRQSMAAQFDKVIQRSHASDGPKVMIYAVSLAVGLVAIVFTLVIAVLS